MVEPNRPTLSLAKKAQLFFVFLVIVTGVIWIMSGPKTTSAQQEVRVIIGIVETVGLIVTTAWAMQKK